MPFFITYNLFPQGTEGRAGLDGIQGRVGDPVSMVFFNYSFMESTKLS